MLEYISAPEAAKKWGISERRVQKLCEENRIPGVAKFSRMWLIPKDEKVEKFLRFSCDTICLRKEALICERKATHRG